MKSNTRLNASPARYLDIEKRAARLSLSEIRADIVIFVYARRVRVRGNNFIREQTSNLICIFMTQMLSLAPRL